jgi:excisionase family DNA binding protein
VIRLVTARELGEMLSLQPGTVLDKWERGELPGHKIGRAVRFDPEEILALTRRETSHHDGGGGLRAARPETPPQAFAGETAKGTVRQG